jgi:non-canonical (house-cleaning) NTP pyrophosphatase
MGYYTDFDFSNNEADVIVAIESVSGYGESENGTYSDIKWYSWEEHIKAVSFEFPDRIIMISGEGEEQGDVWEAYARNGKLKILKAEVTIPKFDENMFN